MPVAIDSAAISWNRNKRRESFFSVTESEMDFFPKAWLARREGKSAIRGLEGINEG